MRYSGLMVFLLLVVAGQSAQADYFNTIARKIGWGISDGYHAPVCPPEGKGNCPNCSPYSAPASCASCTQLPQPVMQYQAQAPQRIAPVRYPEPTYRPASFQQTRYPQIQAPQPAIGPPDAVQLPSAAFHPKPAQPYGW